jgi:uncharacterized protein YfaS (alpha-2-macroglobulin family)
MKKIGFGVPVEGGTVEYSIASQDYYFDKYRDEYFQFGSGWYSCYYDCRYGDQFILRNTVPLSQNGKATIRQPLDYKTLFTNEADRKSKIFVMYITVKDKTGKAVSTQKSFIVHGGEYYLGLNADTSFLQKNQAANIKLKSVDTEGKPKSVGDITLSLRKIKYIQNQRQEVDGSYYYNWERKFDVVSENKISTDGNGNYSNVIDVFTIGSDGKLAKSTENLSLSEGRRGLSAAVIGKKLVSAGGEKSSTSYSNVVDVFSLSK